MKILFATAELRPLVSAGGLGEAAAGLTTALREAGHDVITALPAYQHWELPDELEFALRVPDWAAPASVRVGEHPVAGRLALIEVADIERPDPYVDEHGQGWEDNDVRFARFSRAVAAFAAIEGPDIVHVNDWHTAMTPAFLHDKFPTVLTIHNLAHQGWATNEWLHQMPRHRDQYVRGDGVNMLAGAIRTANRVVAVSPNYAREIVEPADGFELDDLLRSRGDHLVGILNGIDVRQWNPETDEHLTGFGLENFGVGRLAAKAAARDKLLSHAGWADTGEPLIAMVTRLVDQKGVDLALEAARYLGGIGARLMILGSGAKNLAEAAHAAAAADPDRIWFHEGYDVPLSHLMFAGSDMLLMPSRFEPCGLAQMQAMAYGTIPVVTPVGGLVDTVIDADRYDDGTGFVADGVDPTALVDALHRAARAWHQAERREAIQTRGMSLDWSWNDPAAKFISLYEQVLASG